MKSWGKLSRSILKIRDVIEFVDSWTPPGAALQDDNPGLQVGSSNSKLKNILVTLDVTDRIIEEAIENQANLILSHHPLLNKPLKCVDVNSWAGRKVAKLIKHDITVYSAHTNLDGCRDGVSIELARVLGVKNAEFLKAPDQHWLKKIAVFVPETHIDAVREAMSEAGAGVVGDYTHCSFNISGTGTFLGGDSTSPAVGEKGALEMVDEIRLEMLAPDWSISSVISALRASHPYEEAAYDIYNLDNEDVNFGFGAIGNLDKPVPLHELVESIKQNLGLKALCVMEGPAQKVTRLAVCGGSGGALVEDACRQNADVFITGEMKYHAYLEYEDRLTVIVVGHYASERVILPVWTEKLRNWLGDNAVTVIETKMITNPVKYLI
jgi:dinuclear metal center YbgI/SA1388 family protein